MSLPPPFHLSFDTNPRNVVNVLREDLGLTLRTKAGTGLAAEDEQHDGSDL